jgi:hypothetical protein
MEAIFSFLFDNPFLSILLLIILFSMLGRSGRKSGGGSRMPDFGGGPGSRRMPGQGTPDGSRRSGETPGRQDASRHPETSEQPDIPRRPERSDAGGFPREWRSGRQLDEYGQEVIADVRPARASGPLPGTGQTDRHAAPPAASDDVWPSPASDAIAARSDAASQVAPALQVEHRAARPIAGQDEMRKAIIWAEILGPPRARSPHGRRRIGR